MRWICVLALVAFAPYAVPCDLAFAQEGAPRTLAFVVGIEHYDDSELDRLQYAADDARKLFDQLRMVSDLDPASMLLVADDDDRSRLDADRIRTALQSFVQLIKDRTNVVVYLGGHGTLSPSRTLWYLPSNYSRRTRTGYITMSEIRQALVDWINGQALHNVSLTFLVNMCGAGNAVTGGRVDMAVDDTHELINVARRVFRDEPFGLRRYAIIPATPKERNTFEDPELQSSVFAHHLREGLAGRAAKNGVVTSGSLFNYLVDRLGEDLPRHEDFDADITLGVTRRLEGEASFLVGTALLAAAQALEPAGDGAERAAHRSALLDLAADQFDDVARHASDLAGRARLRGAQVDALRSRMPQTDVSDLTDLVGRGVLKPSEVEELKQLVDARAQGPRTLRELRDALHAGQPFYALIVDTAERPGLSVPTEPGAAAWRRVLEEFPGRREIQTVVLPVDRLDFQASPTLPGGVRATLDGWAAAEEKEDSRRTRLLLVYVGVAGTMPDVDRASRSADPLRETGRGIDPNRVLPFGKAEIELATAGWPGPVTVAYLAAFGGLLSSPGEHARRDVSLLLAAREPNGMTFSAPEGSNAALLARAFQEGVESVEEYAPLLEFTRLIQFRSGMGGDSYVVGTPHWMPNWAQSSWTPVAAQQLGRLKRFALHVAAGCAADPLDVCDAPNTTDPFDVLASAAERDLANDTDTALTRYASAARAVRAVASASRDAPSAVRTRDALQSLASTIERRTIRPARRVVVLPVGVENYTSPLVPDLPGTSTDLKAYGEALARALEKSAVRVVVRDVQLIAAPADLLDSIRQGTDTLGPEDLLILVYSGRGTEIEGRRYLTTGRTRPCEMDDSPTPAGCFAEWTDLVDLWTIADLVQNRWFIGIYDAQFTAPVFEERYDTLLDKHLDSVRRDQSSRGAFAVDYGAVPARLLEPSPQAYGGVSFQGDRASARMGTGRRAVAQNVREPVVLQTVPVGALPPRQLHIWYEGTVTAAAYPPLDCAPPELGAIVSPLAAAVIGELPPKSPGTYREWLQQIAASRCLVLGNDVPARIMAQGNVDLPLFATGQGAELVDYFGSDDARRHANLLAADAVAAAALDRFATGRNRLSRAAILLALGTLRGTPVQPSEGTATAPGGAAFEAWWRPSGTLLEETRLTLEADAPSATRALLAELLARRHVLGGDPSQARAELRAAPPALLAERELADRLVALTEEAARRQPATLLEESSNLLDAAQREVSSRGNVPAAARLAAAQTRLTGLLRAEQSRSTVRYEIAPPSAEREP